MFDHYALAVQLLAERGDAQQVILRAFELLLLRDVGLLPDLAHEGSSLTPLDLQAHYVIDPENGLRLAQEEERQALLGEQWLALQAALDAPDPLIATLRACAPFEVALRPQLRRCCTTIVAFAASRRAS